MQLLGRLFHLIWEEFRLQSSIYLLFYLFFDG